MLQNTDNFLKMKKVVIIGAGPSGLFAAYELVTKAPNTFDITIIDKGGTIQERAQTHDAIKGIGGAGLMSDGKLLFDIRIGNNLNEIMPADENHTLTKQVEEIFIKLGVPLPGEKPQQAFELEKNSLQQGVEFIYQRQTHIGTDKLANLISDFQKFLEQNNVKFICNRDIQALSEIQSLQPDFLILAPGRYGGSSGWLEQRLKELGVKFSYRAVDIGVRIEVPSIITDPVTEITRDMKFYFRTEAYQDKIRTFCTCPNGFVGQELHDGFKTVNGHSESGKSTQNTNFALLVTIPLTQPLSNTNTFARNIGQAFHDLSGGKTLAQRWGDLKRNKRSKQPNQNQYRFQPTMENITWGDLAFAMPARYLRDIREGIEKLDKIMPGIANDETILHAPEIKFHGLKIPTDPYLQIKPGVFVAGDGAGYSRGIVGASASGLRAAQGILKSL